MSRVFRTLVVCVLLLAALFVKVGEKGRAPNLLRKPPSTRTSRQPKLAPRFRQTASLDKSAAAGG